MSSPVMDEKVDHSKFWTWERAARAAIFAQVTMTVAVAIYFAAVTNTQNHVLANQAFAAAASNKAIIQEVRADVTGHARASTDRNCAIADELRYLVHQSPDIKARILRRVDTYTHAACLFIPPHVSVAGG